MGCNDRGTIRFAAICSALLPTSQLAAIPARAEGAYAGIGYAQVNPEDLDTEHPSLVIGTSPNRNPGFEFFYAPTRSEDEFSSAPFDVETSIDTDGMHVDYKTGTDDFNTHVKLKAGMAKIDLEFDFGVLGSLDDDTSGLAYGFAFGTRIGIGALRSATRSCPNSTISRGSRSMPKSICRVSFTTNFD